MYISPRFLCFTLLGLSSITFCTRQSGEARALEWQKKEAKLAYPAPEPQITRSIKPHDKTIETWQSEGVNFVRPDFVVIDPNVQIGTGTTIGCAAHILNGSIIGANCVIGPFCVIDNCHISDGVIIESHSVLQDTVIKKGAKVGPFAHTRNQSVIEEKAEIGNFVELSNSTIGPKSKAKHLTYLGCAIIEEEVNIGAGTITCNYDGFGKNTTLFKRKSFIGSNGTFVAPITIGENAITAAGSTFTNDIPNNAFSIGRSHQIIKNDYVDHLRSKFRLRAKR